MTRSVRPLAGWSVVSVCHIFLEGREVTLPCPYRSTCFFLLRHDIYLCFNINENEYDKVIIFCFLYLGFLVCFMYGNDMNTTAKKHKLAFCNEFYQIFITSGYKTRSPEGGYPASGGVLWMDFP